MRTWAPLPTQWIERGELKQLMWQEGGADAIASLICLILVAHHADPSGAARLTYERIGDIGGLSRAKISGGLTILEGKELVGRSDRSTFRLIGLNMQAPGWGMLPARGLYSAAGSVPFFKRLHLRQRAELDALKLYLLFVARRDRIRNRIDISYDKIFEYSGVHRSKIPDALSILAVNGLLRVERQRSNMNEYATANSYRLSHLDPYRHEGTYGRSNLDFEFNDGSPF